jgi:hypothetical protein
MGESVDANVPGFISAQIAADVRHYSDRRKHLTLQGIRIKSTEISHLTLLLARAFPTMMILHPG